MRQILWIIVLVAVAITIGVLVDQKELFPVTAQPVSPLTYDTKTIHEERESVALDVEYPMWHGLPRAEEDALNTRIQALVDDQTQLLKNSLIDMPPEMRASFSSALTIRFTPFTYTTELVSVLFSIETFSPGAAHPSTYTLPFNYLPKQSFFISLDDLLTSTWPETLSPLATAKLRDEFSVRGIADSGTWLQEGAGPLRKNFQSFALTDTTLVLHFDEYQVAPYAAGAFEITLPLSELQTIWNPESPLPLPHE